MARPEAIVPISSQGKFVNTLIYGDPGTGKSVLAGSSPKALIVANTENEMMAPLIHGSTAEMWVARDYDDLTQAYEYCRHEGYREFEWVWLDNGSLHQEQGMDHIMADLTASKPGRQSPWVPDKPQYLLNQNRFGELVRNFCALPMNFGLTAHVMRTEDEEGVVRMMPSFQGGQGKFSDKICGYVGQIGYLTVVRTREAGNQRSLYLDKRGKFYAKDRYDATKSGVLVDPTIPKLMAGVRKNLPGAAPAVARKVPATGRTTTRRTA